MNRLWFNGQLMPADALVLPFGDRGFLYGDGLFETIRLYGGYPFLLADHLDRLVAGAATIGLTLPYSRKNLEKAVHTVACANRINDGAIRITVSRGAGPRGLAPLEVGSPVAAVSASPGIPYDKSCYDRGLRAVVLPWPRNERSPLSGLKSASCLENVLGMMLARREGAREGLFLNSGGDLAEGTMSNIFLVRRGRVITPSVESGLLPGVVRRLILAHGPVEVEERTVRVEELFGADEAFLTNSILEAAPLVAVDGQPIGGGAPGPVVRSIRQWYHAVVQRETGLPKSTGSP